MTTTLFSGECTILPQRIAGFIHVRRDDDDELLETRLAPETGEELRTYYIPRAPRIEAEVQTIRDLPVSIGGTIKVSFSIYEMDLCVYEVKWESWTSRMKIFTYKTVATKTVTAFG